MTINVVSAFFFSYIKARTSLLPHCDVVASLFALVFYIAAALLAEIAKGFAEHELKRVVAHKATLLTRRRNCFVAIV